MRIRTDGPLGKLQTIRLQKMLTRRELGELSGVNWRTIEHWEQSNAFNNATLIQAKHIANALEVRIEDLMED